MDSVEIRSELRRRGQRKVVESCRGDDAPEGAAQLRELECLGHVRGLVLVLENRGKTVLQSDQALRRLSWARTLLFSS